MKTNTKENIRENGIQSVKVVILGVLLSVGMAFAWTGPTQSPPNGNAPAPINTGSITQEKDGGLIFGKLFTGGAGEATLNVYKDTTTGGVIWAGALGLTGDAIVGRDVTVGKLSADANPGLDITEFPAHVCADADGMLVLCEVDPIIIVNPPGSPVINFTVNGGNSTQTINETANLTTPVAHPVTLNWNVAGATACNSSAILSKAGTDVSSSVGWTGSKSIVGGTSAGVTVKSFGTTQYKLICDADGDFATTTDQATSSVSVTLKGSLILSTPQSGGFGGNNFSNINTIGVQLIGAGGEGAVSTFNGENGGDTSLTSNGPVNIIAKGGGGGDANTGTGGLGGVGTGTNFYSGKNGGDGTLTLTGCGGVPKNSGNYNSTGVLCGGNTKSYGFGGDGSAIGLGGGGAGSTFGGNSQVSVTMPLSLTLNYTIGSGGDNHGNGAQMGGDGYMSLSW